MVWVVLSVVVPTTLGLLLALALNRPLFGRQIPARSGCRPPATWDHFEGLSAMLWA